MSSKKDGIMLILSSPSGAGKTTLVNLLSKIIMARKQTINSKRKTSRRKERVLTDQSILEEIIRVDHAGEFGATRIYDGQIAIFGKKSKIGKTIKHMADQEQEHIETFEKLILNHRVRPTALLPVWNVAGYFLGVATAMMGEKAAMACTVAVEKVIGEHYHKQLSLLKKSIFFHGMFLFLARCL